MTVVARGLWYIESHYREPMPGPCFELYDDRFYPMTGQGGFSLWTPVQARATA